MSGSGVEEIGGGGKRQERVLLGLGLPVYGKDLRPPPSFPPSSILGTCVHCLATGSIAGLGLAPMSHKNTYQGYSFLSIWVKQDCGGSGALEKLGVGMWATEKKML